MTFVSYIELEEQLRLIGRKLALGKTTVADRRKILAGRPPDIVKKIMDYEKRYRKK